MDELLTGTEVAARVGITTETWWNMRSDGKTPLPDATGANGRPLWLPETIDAWVAARPGRGNRTPRLYSREALIRLRAGGSL